MRYICRCDLNVKEEEKSVRFKVVFGQISMKRHLLNIELFYCLLGVLYALCLQGGEQQCAKVITQLKSYNQKLPALATIGRQTFHFEMDPPGISYVFNFPNHPVLLIHTFVKI